MADPRPMPARAKDTLALALPAVAVTPVGAPGNVSGTTALDRPEAGPVPAWFVAFTVKV